MYVHVFVWVKHDDGAGKQKEAEFFILLYYLKDLSFILAGKRIVYMYKNFSNSEEMNILV